MKTTKKQYKVRYTDTTGKKTYLSQGGETRWSKYNAKKQGQRTVAKFGGEYQLEKA